MKRLLALVVILCITVTIAFSQTVNAPRIKQSWKAVVLSPAEGDDIYFKSKKTAVITSIDCVVDPNDSGEQVNVSIEECDSEGDNCSPVEDDISCLNTNTTDDGTLTDSIIDIDDYLYVTIGTTQGTIDTFSLNIYREESLK